MSVGNFLGDYLEGLKMRSNIKLAWILAPLLLMAGTALGSEGVQIKITNDGTQDLSSQCTT